MATTVGVVGESGHGKTTSIRNLDPKTTYIINADKKNLTFPKWRNNYSKKKKNYFPTSDAKKIKAIIKSISERDDMKHINTIVVDTVNGIMVDDEMRRMKTKGYDKWIDLATSIYDIQTQANGWRDDLIIVFMYHLETIADDYGNFHQRILTSGKKLQKIKLESKLPIVLFARCDGDGDNNKYYFETQSKQSTSKSPMGMFKNFKIPNDLELVRKAILNYEN